MNKKSLGWFILKHSLIGQLIEIVVFALLIVFAGYPAKFVIIYLLVTSIFYWSIFGTLAYQFRNYVKR